MSLFLRLGRYFGLDLTTIWLVVEKPSWNIWHRHWEGWHPIYYGPIMENKIHVWNHQPAIIRTFLENSSVLTRSTAVMQRALAELCLNLSHVGFQIKKHLGNVVHLIAQQDRKLCFVCLLLSCFFWWFFLLGCFCWWFCFRLCCCFSPQLCVGFLFLILYPGLLRLPPPPADTHIP